MAAVTMYIEKFGREVLIDEEHPLAIAQRAMKKKSRRAVVEDEDEEETEVEDEETEVEDEDEEETEEADVTPARRPRKKTRPRR